MRTRAWILLLLCGVTARAGAAGKIDFAHDVQPILQQRCVECHGEKKQKSGIRFDRKSTVFKPGDSGKPAVIPGKSGESLLIQRITTTNDDEVMPPKGERLTAAQIATLRAWIDQGATWPGGDEQEKPHWAYVKPTRPAVPKIRNPKSKSQNPIDAFVMARLQKENLKAAPPADRATLLRRVSLDLVGLPPTLEEVQAFEKDKSPDAYEKVVKRLLASPHFGERWARPWLDCARYADTQGYEKDARRTLWPWRDWVIKALNADMPFDEFTVEQLAGDMLPNATQEQKVATGFHRNTMTNTEGGTDDEEFRYEALVDRVNTTWQVWMGSTMACAQCHNHKYDPFTTREYYQFMAFLNNTADADKDDERPTMKVFGPGQEQRLAELKAAVRSAQKNFDHAQARPELAAARRAWETETLAKLTNAAIGATNTIPKEVRAALLVPAPERDKKQSAKIDEYFTATTPQLKELRDALASAAKAEKELNDLIPITAVMQELDKPRETHRHVRGAYLTKAELVTPGTPANMHPFPTNEPLNRLSLAKWIVSTNNPLTARVMVNRAWEQLFGKGIVETVEEFGKQGEPPSHPELLDWLACEFMQPTVPPASRRDHAGNDIVAVDSSKAAARQDAGGTLPWSIKHLLRVIVTSSTYQQSSRVSPELLARDPFNRLLARGPRVRLEGEAIRDQALAVSGLLSRKIGGPSVMPPQPDGVWQVVYSGDKWETSKGEDKYRRGLYTFWRRTSPHPMLVSFDAPSREYCVLKRNRSDTPLQSLNLLNDPAFLECAQALAKTVVAKKNSDTKSRVEFLFRTCLSRKPTTAELDRLTKLYELELSNYRTDSKAAEKLARADLKNSTNESDVVERAAWTVVANVLLNLDEMITKG